MREKVKDNQEKIENNRYGPRASLDGDLEMTNA
jgi:hypothetical protein